MNKLLKTTLVVLCPFLGFSQTGFWNDFSNPDVSSWTPTVANTYKPSVVNNQLQVVTASTGYSNLEYKFAKQNISGNPKLRLKIISPSAFTLRIDLKDSAGNFTSTSPVTVAVTASTTLKRYVLDYTGKFGSVNASKIVQASLFANAGGSFNGTITIDDFVIGDSVKSLVPVVPGKILINQLGYELKGPKTAILQTTTAFTDTISFVIKNASNQVVYKKPLGATQQVSGWTNRFFRTADFSSLQTAGTYTLSIGSNTSYSFEIGANYLFTKTAASMVSFFNSMRSTTTVDNALPFFDPNRTDKANVFGGWKDATGDPGKHMSHLSYANYFNPQQIPFVTWGMLKAYDLNKTQYSSTNATALLAESAFGADYLIKNIDAKGYLYLSVFDDWGGSTTREVCEWGQPGGSSNNQKARTANYQAAMREGAGMAIAALAKASTLNVTVGANQPSAYLNAAVKLYSHLKSAGNGYKTKNLEYCNDHTENIIDYYCGLLAATELYKATQTASYLTDANAYAQKLMALQNSAGVLFADSLKNRPFYHGADEGLPVISLIEYASINPSQKSNLDAFISNWIQAKYSLSTKVTNPFIYPRQYFKEYKTGSLQTAKEGFFMPHSNETSYWWQGENARLASISSAIVAGNRFVNANYNFGTDSISKMANNQLDWILGKNPFDVSMMHGFGSKGYPAYNGLTNIKGGICNGITSDETTETDIAWNVYTDWQNWRWVEQWLPHNSWFLLATAYINNNVNNPYTDCNNVLGGSAKVDSCGTCAGGNTGITPILNKNQCSITSVEHSNMGHSGMELFPNPTKHSITLKVASANHFSYKIIDQNGGVIDSQVATSNEVHYNTSHLKAGIYYVHVVTNGQSENLKFVITK